MRYRPSTDALARTHSFELHWYGPPMAGGDITIEETSNRMRRRERWAYLLLGLGLLVERRWRPPSPLTLRTPPAWGWAVGWPSLRAQVVPFTFDNLPRENIVQLALEFHDGRADDPLADRIAEALWALHTLVSGSVLTDFGMMAYRVPGTLLRGRRHSVVTSASVIDWDNSRPFEERRGWQYGPSLTHRVSVSPLRSWTAIHAVPRAVESPTFEALHFYQESIRKFAFLGDDLTRVMHSDEQPQSQADRAAVESAFLEAFKAIEALAGEPGREERLRKRLTNMGIDPDEPVGYTEKLPIIQRIGQVRDTRDTKAGHGHRPKSVSPITYRELMNAQALARSCLFMRLDHLGAFVAEDSFVWPHKRDDSEDD